jgi:hypothetical protein
MQRKLNDGDPLMTESGEDSALPFAQRRNVLEQQVCIKIGGFWASFASLLLVALVAGMIIAHVRGRPRRRRLEQSNLDREEELVQKALAEHRGGSDGGMKYPMVLVKAEQFLLLRELLDYESARERGLHVMLDSMTAVDKFEEQERIVFLSHQWTSHTVPDPSRVQFTTMLAALQRVMSAKGWNPSRVYVWVDYTCVPQRHRPTRELAISTLSVYASRAHAFVAVVPSVAHHDTGEQLNGGTYQTRLWTRAECLTHMLLNNNVSSMWLATGPDKGQCTLMPDSWLRGSVLRVFDGISTCCTDPDGHANGKVCDRVLLVPALLGLYAALYAAATSPTQPNTNSDRDESGRPEETDPSSPARTSAEMSGGSRPLGGGGRRVRGLRSWSLAPLVGRQSIGVAKPPLQPPLHRSHNSQSSMRRLFQQRQRADKLSAISDNTSLSSALAEMAAESQGRDSAAVASAASLASSAPSSHLESRINAYEMIAAIEDVVFPPTYSHSGPDGRAVKAELFGGLVRAMKARIDTDETLRCQICEGSKQMRSRRMSKKDNRDHHLNGGHDDLEVSISASSETALFREASASSIDNPLAA